MVLLSFLLSLNVSQLFAAEILIIESYHAEYPWDMGYKKALTEQLGNKHQLHFFEMNTKRLAKELYQHRAELAWDEYQRIKPDLVVLGDDNALKFLGPLLSKTPTPVVYLGINNNPRNYNIVAANNITGVLERPLIKRSVLSVSDIIPKSKRILVLFDSGYTAYTSLENIFNNESIATISNIQVEIKLVEEYNIWQKQIIAAKQNGFDAIVLGLYHTIRDKNHHHIAAENVLLWTAQNANLPIFALWDFAIGKDKAIGGLALRSFDQGEAAAGLIEKILSGISPDKLRPITATRGKYIFSRSEVERYNIKLPEHISSATTWVE